MAYPWPGNVRELEHAIEAAVVVSESADIRPDDLPETLLESSTNATPSAFHAAVRDTKIRVVQKALRDAHDNVTAAAHGLGLHPNYLHRLITSLGLRADAGQARGKSR